MHAKMKGGWGRKLGQKREGTKVGMHNIGAAKKRKRRMTLVDISVTTAGKTDSLEEERKRGLQLEN